MDVFHEWSEVSTATWNSPGTAVKFAKCATDLLAIFLDSKPPPTHGWCAGNRKSGLAHVLMGKHKEVNATAAKMAQFESNHSIVLRGWVQYTAAAIALAALFSRHKVSSAVTVALSDAKSENDRTVARLENDALLLELIATDSGETKHEKKEIKRPNLGNEAKYSQIRDYLNQVNVFRHVEGIAMHITECAVATVTCNEPREPKLASYLEKLNEYPQPWRTTREQREANERKLRAQEIKDDEGDWALTAPDDDKMKDKMEDKTEDKPGEATDGGEEDGKEKGEGVA